MSLKNLAKVGLFLCLCPGVATAEKQQISTAADGHVTFHAALDGVTRVAVRDDRIRELVYAETSYEVKNDETTGDIFLRYSGPQDGNDSGFLITEGGNTISYTIVPRDTFTETVLINVAGAQAPARPATTAASAPTRILPVPTPAPEPAEAVPVRATRALTSSKFEKSYGHSSDVEAFISAVLKEGINGATPPSRVHSNAIVKRYHSDRFVGEVRVAKAWEDRMIGEGDYMKDDAVAVWIAEPKLKAGDRTWVVVVKPRKAGS